MSGAGSASDIFCFDPLRKSSSPVNTRVDFFGIQPLFRVSKFRIKSLVIQRLVLPWVDSGN